MVGEVRAVLQPVEEHGAVLVGAGDVPHLEGRGGGEGVGGEVGGMRRRKREKKGKRKNALQSI